MKPLKKGAYTELGALRLSDSGQGSITLGDVGSLVSGDGQASSQGYTRAFRMLSADLIQGYWVDYSDPAIWTPEAVALFDNKTVYMDHDCPVSQWIGVATGARLTTSTGKLGVDADFTIDPEQDALWAKGSITRGLSLQPVPAIRSCSVGIHFEAKPSHMFQDFWEFWCRLGKEVDGSIVRWIVTKIVRCVEVSLVYAGADMGANALSLSADARQFINQAMAPPAPVMQGEDIMSALLAKALKDCTGLEGDTAVPALYGLKEKADQAEATATRLTDAQALCAKYESEIRAGLISEGLARRNLNAAMTKDTTAPDGKIIATSWANSITLDALRLHVRGDEGRNIAAAPSMGTEQVPAPIGTAANNARQPSALPPAVRSPRTGAGAKYTADIAAAFNQTPDQILDMHNQRMTGVRS